MQLYIPFCAFFDSMPLVEIHRHLGNTRNMHEAASTICRVGKKKLPRASNGIDANFNSRANKVYRCPIFVALFFLLARPVLRSSVIILSAARRAAIFFLLGWRAFSHFARAIGIESLCKAVSYNGHSHRLPPKITLARAYVQELTFILFIRRFSAVRTQKH